MEAGYHRSQYKYPRIYREACHMDATILYGYAQCSVQSEPNQTCLQFLSEIVHLHFDSGRRSQV